MASNEEKMRWISLTAIQLKNMEQVIEQTILDFDHDYALLVARKELTRRLFLKDIEPRDIDTLEHMVELVQNNLSEPHKNFIETIKTVLTTLEQIKDNSKASALSELNFILGICYTILPLEDDSDKQEENQFTAIRCFKKTLEYAQQTENNSALAITSRWLGDAYLRMPRDSCEEAKFHISWAIRYYNYAKEKAQTIRDDYELTKIQLGLASCYSLLPISHFAENMETILIYVIQVKLRLMEMLLIDYSIHLRNAS